MIRSRGEWTNEHALLRPLISILGHNFVVFSVLWTTRGHDVSQIGNVVFQVHSVTEKGLRHLMPLVPSTSGDPSQPSSSQSASPPARAPADSTTTADWDLDAEYANSSGDPTSFPCIVCAVPFTTCEELYEHQSESGHLELKQTPNGPGYLCWQKGCNQYFKTTAAVQVHFR